MTSLADADLSQLVDEWLDWSQTAQVLGVTPAKVRTMVRVHELAAAVSAPGAGPRVPAAFLDDDLPGRPIDALRENRGSEVKRRAQAMGV